ncbi:hemolysin III family protein [Lactobacillus sanfranciscensis]|uniref:Hemolysin-3 n=1 Tax=Fructilactobacillus sanfranciscensis (strain TMW 1.1304) TaxID=714313 RepID=G2KW05_FRUST|nr:hemolysin III family protein [Fructilactobacillus sanfranciscensis]AEN99676.1 Hemolysin-3 [Fructilactobacillus sanfranciscensis TMW 1.1304]NDR76401.1 hemolysin III family protein [Fructilactobacillus sanfranciscensis]NDR97038.1 hemolysin III family protein [Fructilactobacillus sanfranciscensis]NDS04931.1 hemolysin III family protein [Fructilactobacillus sanfranciscensis]POH18995.1 hemolysin III [Fructilactobacillus sanfranciscensis]
MIEKFRQSRNYRILDEILSAMTHGFGVALSIAGLVLIILRGVEVGGAMRITAFSIYGSILVLFYLASTLFHSLVFTKAKKVFQIFDHSAIYLLIAGTYLPYCLVTIGGILGWTTLIIIWATAIAGIIYKSLYGNQYPIGSTIIYVIMGWMCLIDIWPLWNNLSHLSFWLLVLGGIAFTLGAVIYSFKKILFGHVIWHLFVMLGTVLMYFSIYLSV